MNNYKPKALRIIENKETLEKLLFKVGFQKMMYGDNSIFDNSIHHVPHYKALVNKGNNELLSVVTENYHLVTNEDALNMGKVAIKKLFNEFKLQDEDLVPFRVWHNKKMTACSIDLIYKTVTFDAFKQDTWLPFVRVINSYNKQYKLKFVIGFVRSLCSNSMIFEGKTINYSFAHSKGAVPVELKVDQNIYLNQKAAFIDYLQNFAGNIIETDNVISHVYKALKIEEKDFTNLPSNKEKFDSLVLDIWDCYSGNSNNSAYSLFNVVTDLASNHPLGQLTGLVKFESEINNSMLVSKWVKDYSDALNQETYDEMEYLNS